jgi:hypothetical protein
MTGLELGFSSALAAETKLTTPAAASATVHLSNFISSSDLIDLIAYNVFRSNFASKKEGKTRLSSHQNRCIGRIDMEKQPN